MVQARLPHGPEHHPHALTGIEASIDRLLAGKARSRGVPNGFAAFADRLADLALPLPEPNRLKGWWVYRMLFGPDPLTERLTLMWHDHFATSNLEVNDLLLMRRQNETLRSLCRRRIGRLLHTMLRDSALLVWLDAQENTRGHPNENLARELMELFTLGIDHFTTADRLEAVAAIRDGQSPYPDAKLARRLALAARLIKAGLGTRVYYLEQGDHDCGCLDRSTRECVDREGPIP